MKKSINFRLSVAFILIFLSLIKPAMAAKPLPVIESSNGYPSGAHHNLNINGQAGFLMQVST